MGVFDVQCAASGIVLDGRTRLLFVLDSPEGPSPCLPPLSGTYDRYGKIEDVRPGPARSVAEKVAKKLDLDELEELFDAAFEDGAALGKRTLRYALVDELVYRAIVATVASGGVSGVPADREAALAAMKLDDLVAAALADPQLALPLLKPHVDDEELRHDLVSLALFREMPLSLSLTTVDSPSGQYLFFHESRAKQADGLAAETETRAAEKKFASYPLVLAAIAENERVWLERENENLSEDEDQDEDDDETSKYTVSLEAPAGHRIPPLLTAFGEWLEERTYGAVGYFELIAAAAPAEWDPKLADRLRETMPFLTLPDGSLLVLVKHGERSPVALLGSEGETRTVAPSLGDFLLDLAAADTDIMELDDEDATDRDDLAAWLEENEVARVKAPPFDFSAWLAGTAKPKRR